MARTTALLISRQPLRPSGQTPWVAKTVQAVNWIKNHGLTLCTSTGMQTWDLVTALGSLQQISLRVFTMASREKLPALKQEILQQFGLRPEACELVPCRGDNKLDRKNGLLLGRDMAIIDEAELLIPISIRPDGHMFRLTEEARLAGKQIVADFQVLEPLRSPALAYRLNPANLNPALDEIGSKYLTHWTRTTNTAWPGETLVAFYRDIASSPRFPRTAFDTLQRILATGKLIASSRHMPGSTPIVAFTELSPREVVPLMKWRARYTEMTFEPYGIGIPKNMAEDLGIKPVHYVSDPQRRDIVNEESWLCQSMGLHTDWRQEKEHRHLGDFSIGNLPRSALIAFTRFPSEARSLEVKTGVTAIPFCLSEAATIRSHKQKAGST